MDILTRYGYNSADAVVLAVLILGFIIGKNRGIVAMVLRVIYGVASFGASLIFYPLVSGVIRQTPLFEMMKNSIISALGLEESVQLYTKQQELNLISTLKLPEPLKDKLMENNNSVIYDLIGADGFVDYIAGFVANLVVNVVLVWILFVLFLFLLRVLLKGLDAISKLPVLNGINRLGGAVMGVFFAAILIWLGLTLIYVFITKPVVYDMYMSIANSKLAIWFYDNNLLLSLILKRLF